MISFAAFKKDSYKYQWQKGYNVQGSSTEWQDLTNGNSNSYLLTANEVGYFIKCKVIAVTGGTDSEPVYASIDSSPLPPQRIASSTAYVQQDGSGYINGAIRFFWDVSEGADGYLKQ